MIAFTMLISSPTRPQNKNANRLLASNPCYIVKFVWTCLGEMCMVRSKWTLLNVPVRTILDPPLISLTGGKSSTIQSRPLPHHFYAINPRVEQITVPAHSTVIR